LIEFSPVNTAEIEADWEHYGMVNGDPPVLAPFTGLSLFTFEWCFYFNLLAVYHDLLKD